MRYVAIGDSFTEGVGDELPDGTVRGWADLVAAGLATAEGSIEYANLAIRGRLLEPIIREQLPAAMALSPPPTLLSLNGGGNDMMRPGMETARLVELTRRAVRRCAEAGVRNELMGARQHRDRVQLDRAEMAEDTADAGSAVGRAEKALGAEGDAAGFVCREIGGGARGRHGPHDRRRH